MRTPYGAECRYYYEDFYRGREVQECRLIEGQSDAQYWKVDYCKTCPVPGVQRANACENMVLEGKVNRGILGLNRRMAVQAHCTKTKRQVDEPHIGCGECHAGLTRIEDLLRGIE